ncbi:MAG TPA: hypothetical protein VK388_08460 [Pyrinomonadaceae bacterium]|nr:hypothetical protein [Pyrinomonadaceae bacterium]
MKKIAQFCLLALVCALTADASPVRAQGAKGDATAPGANNAKPASLPARPVADRLAPAGWTRYEIGEPARFSLILPGEPAAKVDEPEIIHGVTATVRNFMSVTDSGVYGVSYLDTLPPALLDEKRKREFSERFVKGLAEGFQVGMKARGMDVTLTMSEQRTTAVGGLAGYEQDFSYGEATGRVRLVFDARSAYAVVAIWNALSSNSERKAFFKSLKVNAKR